MYWGREILIKHHQIRYQIEHIKDKVVSVNSDGVETENNGFFNGVTVVGTTVL